VGFSVPETSSDDEVSRKQAITLAARSEVHAFYNSLNIAIVNSNPTRGMDERVSLFILYCVGTDFCDGMTPVQGAI
jgi:hypothetical protein